MAQSDIVNRLFTSFQELEAAIMSAKNTLASKAAVPADVLKRLNSYDEILASQRKYASTLDEHIKAGNWTEVPRLVNLINSLSGMIRDDARAILSSLNLNSDASPDEQLPVC